MDHNQSEQEPEKVELATLSLPVAATNQGLETGDGVMVILEAPKETVDLLQLDDASMAVNSPQFQISAVVDLEKLSELVGVSEDEFITGLHQEVQESRTPAEEEPTEAELKYLADEETPLFTQEAGTETEQIQLPADPFLESLAQVLPTVEEDTILEDTRVAHTKAAATTAICPEEDDEPQHLAHDAFLLSVSAPGAATDADVETKFVLALPEIQLVTPGVSSETFDLSAEAWFEQPLEKAMSILPSELPTDVEAVHLEVTKHEPTKDDPTPVHLDIVVERKVPLIGYLILFAGLFALASVGAALDMQQGGATPVMKTLWRQTATCCVLLPMVLVSFKRDGLPQLRTAECGLLAVCAAAYAYMTLAFVLALEMTTLANAFVLSNMTSLVIIAARAALGLPVLLAEGTGAVIGFLGAAICAGAEAQLEADTDSGMAEHISSADLSRRFLEEEDSSSNLALLGNSVALSASFGTAIYLLIAKNLRPKMDLMVFMFSVMGIGTLFLLAFAMIGNSGTHITFDRHPVHGFFGWINLQPDRLPLELYMAIVCNCLGTMGYIAVLKYFDAIVPATVMLLEPVVGALLGRLAGTAPLPGLQTWLGDLVVAGGTFLVIQAGARKTESINATEALRPGLDDDGETDLRKSLLSRSSTSSTEKMLVAASEDCTAKVVWETSPTQ